MVGSPNHRRLFIETDVSLGYPCTGGNALHLVVIFAFFVPAEMKLK